MYLDRRQPRTIGSTGWGIADRERISKSKYGTKLISLELVLREKAKLADKPCHRAPASGGDMKAAVSQRCRRAAGSKRMAYTFRLGSHQNEGGSVGLKKIAQ